MITLIPGVGALPTPSMLTSRDAELTHGGCEFISLRLWALEAKTYGIVRNVRQPRGENDDPLKHRRKD
ncbi:hypothetical protein BURKHO8Y_350013 [Burkholderia sp. 8Y]|nr:hypothetical protein BURKHO8Y_350013 [Burkholderia sp. 8Y]